MTKYYLNGQLVRTSKTHDNYKYALVCERSNGEKIVRSCSATIQGASRDFNYWNSRSFKVYIAELTKVSA